MRRLLISKQGLLDTGANISCIGADLAARDWSSFKQFRKISSHVRTADGGSQAVTGTLNVEVAYNNAKHPVTFFVIPTIEKRVILGIDFWKTFQLVPGLISAIDPPISTVESPPDNEESFPLTQIQKKRLDGTMCRLVDELIPADLKHCVFGYLDDVCVVSEDFDTHLSVLLRLSEQFRKANLTLNIAKSRFCVTEVQYLGFVIGRGGIATDPSKVDAIRSWPSPKTLKQARRFLGLSNASERVNRSLVAGIRAFLEGNHSEWDAHIHAISCALRNATHQSIGCSPYHALYGFDMMTHGTQYELLHKLGMLNESENVLHRDDLLKLLRKQLRDNIAVAHEQQSKQYNLRTREISYKVGQEVFRRNFAQSNFAKQFNAKLCPQWIKSRSSLLLRAKNSPSRLLLLAASSSPPRREKEANPTTAGKSVASFDLAMYSRPF
ncbi:hypothetical protein ACLKA7_005213 [Drosophila subpalustris]